MSRGLIVVAVMLWTGVSWGLEWEKCSGELNKAAKLSNEASALAITLRNTYEKYQMKKYEYESCVSFRGDCQYLPLQMNRILGDYEEERSRFTKLMQSINGHTTAMKETCGYEFR